MSSWLDFRSLREWKASNQRSVSSSYLDVVKTIVPIAARKVSDCIRVLLFLTLVLFFSVAPLPYFALDFRPAHGRRVSLSDLSAEIHIYPPRRCFMESLVMYAYKNTIIK